VLEFIKPENDKMFGKKFQNFSNTDEFYNLRSSVDINRIIQQIKSTNYSLNFTMKDAQGVLYSQILINNNTPTLNETDNMYINKISYENGNKLITKIINNKINEEHINRELQLSCFSAGLRIFLDTLKVIIATKIEDNTVHFYSIDYSSLQKGLLSVSDENNWNDKYVSLIERCKNDDTTLSGPPLFKFSINLENGVTNTNIIQKNTKIPTIKGKLWEGFFYYNKNMSGGRKQRNKKRTYKKLRKHKNKSSRRYKRQTKHKRQ